jgi:F420-dependent oxidoreductase-like protein
VRFGLQIPRYTWAGGPHELAPRLRRIAAAAETAGFEHLWVMDHFRQIPSVGRPWEDMLESWTTLAYLAGVTDTIRLGTLVSGVTYRNVAHLAKIVATLDVLSGGRATCGLGAAWFRDEHLAYGWTFPSARERFALLEDALQLLPLMWGPGAPAFAGKAISVPEAMCYPRPLQARIPLLVGGSGERTTLRLVARYADACNLFGEAPTIAHKVEVLRRHCAEVGRDPADIEVTQLSTVLIGRDAAEVGALVDGLRPRRVSAERFARQVNAGTVEQHAGRVRDLVAAGVQTVIFSLADLDGPAQVERFADVIAHFRADVGEEVGETRE